MGEAKFVGVDWAKGGWFSIAYDSDGNWEARQIRQFCDVVEYYGKAELILVDIPIGLAKGEYEWRKCDLEARKCLGRRWQSVFLTPPRHIVEDAWKAKAAAATHAQFLNAYMHVNKHRKERMGFSIQSWNITPMIAEVDEVMTSGSRRSTLEIREIHPEICFWALNKKKAMAFSKKNGDGQRERIDVLRTFEPRAQEILAAVQKEYRAKAADDDILDALAAAVTARLGYPDRLATLPDDPPTDARGLPMEMVFYNPRHA